MLVGVAGLAIDPRASEDAQQLIGQLHAGRDEIVTPAHQGAQGVGPSSGQPTRQSPRGHESRNTASAQAPRRVNVEALPTALASFNMQKAVQ
jgi:hypothetical protein